MSNYNKIIFHIDMDAYFAQVEEIRHPQFKGKPIAVGGKKTRDILSTSNYIAREYGLYSGIPYFKAIKMCPELIVFNTDHSYYKKLSNEIFKFIEKKYKQTIEVNSIDECFIDMTPILRGFKGSYIDLAKDIQQNIFNLFEMTISIGISDKKMLSKIATDFNKPNGITTLFTNEIKRKLWNKKVGTLMGIGKKTVEKLNEMDIISIFDFIIQYEKNNEKLMKLMGKSSQNFYEQAIGKMDFPVVKELQDSKSISKDITFHKNLESWEEVVKEIKKISLFLANNLNEDSLIGNIIKVSLKFEKFKSHSMQIKLKIYTNDFKEIFHQATLLFHKLWEKYNLIPIKFISVGVSGLKNIFDIPIQVSISEYEKYTNESEKRKKAKELQGLVNNKFKNKLIGIAQDIKDSGKMKNENEPIKRKGAKLIIKEFSDEK